ncbi:helix-turn-helix transcriptional regulator [bacterium]|nr:helix-turn-helix transcriptional regulator [bacterium]
MNRQEIGKKIKFYRQISNLTQEQLAEKVGIHEKQISRIESGIHFPTFDNLIKIMNALNIEFKDLDLSNESKNAVKEKLIKIIKSLKDQDAKLFLAIIEDIKKYRN